MSQKVSINLPKPKLASNDCLPHAAMNLGAGGGAGMRPISRLVSRLVAEEQYGSWILYRIDDGGGFVGDTWHDTREDALRQMEKEFGVDITPFQGKAAESSPTEPTA